MRLTTAYPHPLATLHEQLPPGKTNFNTTLLPSFELNNPKSGNKDFKETLCLSFESSLGKDTSIEIQALESVPAPMNEVCLEFAFKPLE